MSPIVSVVMPVYNGEKYLEEALKSILCQTLTDFELIVVNDSSTDSSSFIVEEFARQDSRIRFYNNERNLGLPQTLNRGLELVRGDYIARMDQDDISLPERLEKQIQYMQTHLEMDICGSWAEVIGDRAGEIWKYPTGHDEIFAGMLFANMLVHPSVVMRTSAIRQYALYYDGNATHIEDYDLWSRALPLLQFANFPESLLMYRLHGSNTSDLHGSQQNKGRALIYSRFLSLLELEYSEADLALHEMIGSYRYDAKLSFLQATRIWLEKIAAANEKVGLISPGALNAELGSRWTGACQLSNSALLPLCIEILSSHLPFRGSTGRIKLWYGFKFLIRRIVSAKKR